MLSGEEFEVLKNLVSTEFSFIENVEKTQNGVNFKINFAKCLEYLKSNSGSMDSIVKVSKNVFSENVINKFKSMMIKATPGGGLRRRRRRRRRRSRRQTKMRKTIRGGTPTARPTVRSAADPLAGLIGLIFGAFFMCVLVCFVIGCPCFQICFVICGVGCQGINDGIINCGICRYFCTCCENRGNQYRVQPEIGEANAVVLRFTRNPNNNNNNNNNNIFVDIETTNEADEESQIHNSPRQGSPPLLQPSSQSSTTVNTPVNGWVSVPLESQNRNRNNNENDLVVTEFEGGYRTPQRGTSRRRFRYRH